MIASGREAMAITEAWEPPAHLGRGHRDASFVSMVILKQQRRRALPLYSIVTGFDLWPTAPSPPNSALLLLL
ncbi:hypothetical protein BHE74_00009465 [Ensete ventricosum]|nr:hypothetical protein BHE74_00009465 [Ensete ventricosum]